MGKSLTHEEFITKANKVHNNKFSYPENYIKSNAKIKIICPIHGIFSQEAARHLYGSGCRLCGNISVGASLRNDNNFFLKKANIIHNNKYIYHEKYIKNNIKINIECPIHGKFLQKPDSHLNGKGCHPCGLIKRAITKTKDNESFIKRAIIIHNNKYEYIDTYKKSYLKIKIKCPIHGMFSQTPNLHLSGAGCDHCGGTHKKTTNEFVKKANLVHKNKYTYPDNYLNAKEKININCKLHGIFSQIAGNHLRGHGCAKCISIISEPEIKWLYSLNIPLNFRQKRITINNKNFVVDAYDPIINTVYEFYGDFWHGNPKKFNSSEMNLIVKKTYGELYNEVLKREETLKSLGYNIVSIWESDWKN